MRNLAEQIRANLMDRLTRVHQQDQQLIWGWQRNQPMSTTGAASSAEPPGPPETNPHAPAPQTSPPATPLEEKRIIRLVKRPNEPLRAIQYKVIWDGKKVREYV